MDVYVFSVCIFLFSNNEHLGSGLCGVRGGQWVVVGAAVVVVGEAVVVVGASVVVVGADRKSVV